MSRTRRPVPRRKESHISGKSSSRERNLLLNVVVVLSTLGAGYTVYSRATERGPRMDRLPRVETVADSLENGSWISLAHDAGISDTVAFRMCLGDPAIGAIVDRDVAAAAKLGAVVTPTLLINDLKVLGYTDQDTLTQFGSAAFGATEAGSLPR